jgi:hypothetical protein
VFEFNADYYIHKSTGIIINRIRVHVMVDLTLLYIY